MSDKNAHIIEGIRIKSNRKALEAYYGRAIASQTFGDQQFMFWEPRIRCIA